VGGLCNVTPECGCHSSFQNQHQAIEVLIVAYADKMTPSAIRQGFTICGQHCAPDSEGSTIDFEKMMAQCYTDISVEDMDHMRSLVPAMSLLFQEHGQITWEQLDEAGVITSPTSMNRSALNHIRRWGELVTHPETRERYHAEMLSRNPSVVKERSSAATALKKATTLVKQTAKKTATAAAKAAADMVKKAEADRIKTLPADEQKAIKDQERALKAAAKEQKAEIKRKKEEAAALTLEAATAMVLAGGGGH
jgi:hypothetical protein